MDEKFTLALHEACHVVAARTLGVEVVDASADPDSPRTVFVGATPEQKKLILMAGLLFDALGRNIDIRAPILMPASRDWRELHAMLKPGEWVPLQVHAAVFIDEHRKAIAKTAVDLLIRPSRRIIEIARMLTVLETLPPEGWRVRIISPTDFEFVLLGGGRARDYGLVCGAVGVSKELLERGREVGIPEDEVWELGKQANQIAREREARVAVIAASLINAGTMVLPPEQWIAA